MTAKKKVLDTDVVASELRSELSGMAFFQPPAQADTTTNLQTGKTTKPQAHKTTSRQTGKALSGQVDKRVSGQTDTTAKPQVEKYTTHLEPELIKWVKVYAAQNDLKDYEVVGAAIAAYREQHQ
jgi:hypothetical protein